MRGILLILFTAHLFFIGYSRAILVEFPPKQEEEKKKIKKLMAFKKRTINRKKIEYGDEGKFVFEFKNKSNRPLVILSIETTCGCVSGTSEKVTTDPGAIGKIEVLYDTERIGEFSKIVIVNTNLSDNPVILTVKGRVEAPN